ncbi:MAG: hypothetical protein QXP36_00420 [Conexivisphaerales archaeon]
MSRIETEKYILEQQGNNVEIYSKDGVIHQIDSKEFISGIFPVLSNLQQRFFMVKEVHNLDSYDIVVSLIPNGSYYQKSFLTNYRDPMALFYMFFKDGKYIGGYTNKHYFFESINSNLFIPLGYGGLLYESPKPKFSFMLNESIIKYPFINNYIVYFDNFWRDTEEVEWIDKSKRIKIGEIMKKSLQYISNSSSLYRKMIVVYSPNTDNLYFYIIGRLIQFNIKTQKEVEKDIHISLFDEIFTQETLTTGMRLTNRKTQEIIATLDNSPTGVNIDIVDDRPVLWDTESFSSYWDEINQQYIFKDYFLIQATDHYRRVDGIPMAFNNSIYVIKPKNTTSYRISKPYNPNELKNTKKIFYQYKVPINYRFMAATGSSFFILDAAEFIEKNVEKNRSIDIALERT